ncbi:GDYXXLXY domain-containing protein [Ottowia testudinis]|uniref:GDYXXLXY domain-containing protein n=1 Tax=Ottowia testudinis TaxID=2816950 RepID=A0A975H7J7_9BURK|nr:GDYXXLXY domain-containing protein [Ottowia testudinis]QTD47132.1 GDYXXLXY domain-containing protein [Ottowia testudinis]
MSAAIPPERRLVEAAQAEQLLPPEATAAWREEGGPSWIITVLSFLGAQLVVLPFLAFLGLLAYRLFFEPPGTFIAAAMLIGGASVLLHARPGMFLEQLSFSALLAGLALLVVGFRAELSNVVLLVLLVVLLGVALVARVPWVQRVLGFLAGLAFLLLVLWPVGGLPGGDAWTDSMWRLVAFPMVLNAALLALAWAWWAATEPRWSGRAAAPALHALADGVGVALLLAVAYGSTRHFWTLDFLGRGPAGSADDPTAGLARIFTLGWPALLQMALVVISAAWLMRHWRLRQTAQPRGLGLMALVYAVLLLACFVIPHVGVVALVGTLALGTGRRLMLGLALATLLAQLSGFYYALAWPLAHKAALLAGIGAALGLALWALRERTAPGAPLTAPALDAGPRWMAPVLIAAGALLALTTVHFDVKKKEEVIAQGQKIYVPLAPRDPRSLMQGDYMALNFAFPSDVHKALAEDDALGATRHAHVVATLDARGVATVLRVARAGEALATGERLLPVKRLKHDWVLVTDAFFFPEGQGEPFASARFGEFRALPDGRALLVGLADEHLQAIQPAPRKKPKE